ncbi:MAG: hypothetical protein AAGH92_12310, partial [Planctomycetota bacterium]
SDFRGPDYNTSGINAGPVVLENNDIYATNGADIALIGPRFDVSDKAAYAANGLGNLTARNNTYQHTESTNVFYSDAWGSDANPTAVDFDGWKTALTTAGAPVAETGSTMQVGLTSGNSPSIASVGSTGTVVNAGRIDTTYDGETRGVGSHNTFGLRQNSTLTLNLQSPAAVSGLDIAFGTATTKELRIEVRVSGAWQTVGDYTFTSSPAGSYDSVGFSPIANATDVRLTALDDWIYIDEVVVA